MNRYFFFSSGDSSKDNIGKYSNNSDNDYNSNTDNGEIFII